MTAAGSEDSAAAAARVEPAPPVAGEVFGERLDLARHYAELLVTDGVQRGLIGPREAARVWSRHVLNCAVVTELFGDRNRVVDVGSGAGLPGVVMAIRRPDLRVDLVEPLQRRVTFLTEAVDALGLHQQVRVVRGRAEEPEIVRAVGGADWVTARAVAPMDRLMKWCLPLLARSGRLALLKGDSVREELRRQGPQLRRAGIPEPDIVRCGIGLVEPAVTVVTVEAPVISRGRR
jgi:16S rRNA (guanine527-N7)-methyltransferase